MSKRVYMACCAACIAVSVAACGLAGCGNSYEGTGSKDAASAEQLAQHLDDPWDAAISVDPSKKCEIELKDGVYTGEGTGMAGVIGVKIKVKDNHITCLEVTQDGESQSVGGYEAVRDGTYAQMIEAAQGADIDAVSGATVTTAGVKAAVRNALAKAAVDGPDAVSGATAAVPEEAGSDDSSEASGDSGESSGEDDAASQE